MPLNRDRKEELYAFTQGIKEARLREWVGKDDVTVYGVVLDGFPRGMPYACMLGIYLYLETSPHPSLAKDLRVYPGRVEGLKKKDIHDRKVIIADTTLNDLTIPLRVARALAQAERVWHSRMRGVRYVSATPVRSYTLADIMREAMNAYGDDVPIHLSDLRLDAESKMKSAMGEAQIPPAPGGYAVVEPESCLAVPLGLALRQKGSIAYPLATSSEEVARLPEGVVPVFFDGLDRVDVERLLRRRYPTDEAWRAAKLLRRETREAARARSPVVEIPLTDNLIPLLEE
ncbi:MAG: hypothetical protein HY520_00015 [Candidatus Aenigmarchaeota archaeon]|nr:hypothetical protein [Candidatus Aenigmarchaeota archaeon]